MCLPGCCPETAVIYLPIPLQYLCQNIPLPKKLVATHRCVYPTLWNPLATDSTHDPPTDSLLYNAAHERHCDIIFTLNIQNVNLEICGKMASGNKYCVRIFNLGIRRRWVVSFTPRPLYPRGKIPPGTLWIGGWVDPRAGLDDVEKRKFLTLSGLELRLLGRPARSQSLFFLICIVGGGIKVHSTLRPPMAYCASPGWLWWWRNRRNDWQGKPKYSERTCPSAALCTTNPTCCPYANPGRRSGKPASNRLSYGTALASRYTYYAIPAIVEKASLLIRCLAIDVLLLRAYASAGMCLPSRCLAMGLYVTILWLC
jgi:hypothetical protein